MNAAAPALAMDKDLPTELRELLNSPNGAEFEQALDAIVRQREQHMFRALGQLARDLHDAVRRLGTDLAQDGFPGNVADARQYLQDALEMSANAAHRTIDFAERMRLPSHGVQSNDGDAEWWATDRRGPQSTQTTQKLQQKQQLPGCG